jgi:hypothetical protein
MHNSITFAKPKFEVVKMSKLHTNIRKIVVGDSCNQILLGGVCTQFAKQVHTFNNSTSYEDYNGCLYGFNPFYGNMHRFITNLVDDRTPRMFRYSDNIWWFDGETFLGFDVAKMEASSTVEEAQIIMQFIISTVDEHVSDPVGAAMVFVQGSSLCHDNYVIRSGRAMQSLGLSSGSQNTFWVNELRSASATEELKRMVSDGHKSRFHDAFTNGAPLDTQGYMVPFVLEPTACDDPAKFPAYVDTDHPAGVHYQQHFVSLKEYFAYDDASTLPHGTIDEPGPTINMDLLGFNATPVLVDDEIKFCACLAHHRVWKIALFRKSESRDVKIGDTRRAKNSTDQLIDHAINYFTTLTAIWVGGYAYADLLVLLTHMSRFLALNLVQRMSAYQGVDKKEVLAAIIKEFGESMASTVATGMDEDDWDQTMETTSMGLADGDHVKFADKVAGLFQPLIGILVSDKTDEEKVAEMTTRATRSFALQALHLPAGPHRRTRGTRSGRKTETYAMEFI